MSSAVRIRRAWAWGAATLLALGCGSRFYGVDSPVPGDGGAAGAGGEPSLEGGASPSGNGGAGPSGNGGAAPTAGGPVAGGPGGGGADAGGGALGSSGALPLGGGGSGSEPSPVPTDGLELWFDAFVGVTQMNGGVVKWQDRSPHGRHASQEDAGLQPLLAAEALNGKPALVFDGNDDFLNVPALPGDFDAGVSVFVVGRTDSSEACMGYFEASNGSEVDDVHLGFWQAHYLFEVATPYLEVPVDQVLLTPEVVVGIQESSGDVQLRRNSKVLGSSQFALPVLIPRERVYVGKTEYGGCRVLDGRISELLVYSRGLGLAEVERVEAHLQQKWACCAP